MQTVFAEKTEDRSLDDNRHIGELFFIRMYWEKREDSVWKYSVLEGCQKRGCTDQFHRI